jgi:hypothetical protein
MLISLLVLFASEASIHRPFGNIFSLLYKYIPFLIVFRYAFNSHYEILFLVSILAGFTFGKALDGSVSGKHRLKTLVITCVMLLLLAYYLYVGSFVQLSIPGIPYGVGSSYATLLPFVHTIPSYTVSIASFINSQKGDFAIATLPVDDDWHLATWYDAPDVYAGLINKQVYTGGFAESAFFFPPSQDEYLYIGKMVQNGNTNNLSVANALGAFGIKYIIVQGDTSNDSLSPNNPLISYSFNDIYTNMNSSVHMLLIGRYNTSSIYQNYDMVPLVYATNIHIINSSSSTAIINALMNKSLNTSQYSVYSSNFSAPILWYGSTMIFVSNNTNIGPLQTFSKPKITYTKMSPTSVSVYVNNATTPYYLVFRETYDPHWAAFYSNGTKVSPRDHIAVNGFANAWYMNKTGNYTVTLYYTPQTIAWISWAVSFAALGATCSIGFLGYRQQRKRSR